MYTLLFRVPQASLSTEAMELDVLEQYEKLDMDGVCSSYWPLLATQLALPGNAASTPIVYEEEDGLAIFEWSKEFIQAYCSLDKQVLASAVNELERVQACPGVDCALAHDAAIELQEFLGNTLRSQFAVIEYATF